jgi:polysaccharide export outer membrane protein
MLVGFLTLAGGAFAQSPGDIRDYRLAPGDRITVTVFGQMELSGDVLVDGAGTIRLPIIGAVPVLGLTIVETETLIRERLADGILVRPMINVRIGELRPLYVLGDVRAPGAYPFRYGSSVKSAIALAGGLGLAVTSAATVMSEFLSADERVRQLSLQRQSLRIRQARLEAQRDGKTSFSLPTSLNAAEEGAAAEVVAMEQQTLDAQVLMLKNQLELLRSQKPRLESEISSLQSQIDAANKQRNLVKERVDQYGRMVKQGLGLANTELQFKLTEATYESELWRLTALVSRLKIDLGELDVKINEAEAAFKRQLIAELREVTERLRELDVTLPSALEIRQVKLRQTTSLPNAALTITVIRTRDGKLATLPANDSMLLEPGDILEIRQELPTDAPRQDAIRGGPDDPTSHARAIPPRRSTTPPVQ